VKTYTSDKRTEQRQSTRARIIEAAKREFETKGYAKASIRSIAKTCGIATGTVLDHFQSKQDLCHSALFEDLSAVWSELRNAPSTGSLLEDYMAVAVKMFGYYEARPVLSRELLRESIFASEPWATEFMNQVTEVNQVLTSWAAEAIASGRLAATANPLLVATAFLSYYYFALLAWVQGGITQPLSMIRSLTAHHLQFLEAA
jgi:AcrR family transcriptional regulator